MSMSTNNDNPKNQKPNNKVVGEQDYLDMQDAKSNTPYKKNPWEDIFLGLGLSMLLLLSMAATLYTGQMAIASIIMFILLSCATFLSVRFLRRNRPIAGKILLTTVIPLTLLLLLFGACFISIGGAL